MNLRIAMLAWESLHSIRVGGLAAHVSELAEALQQLGHEVHVLTRMDSGQPAYSCIRGVHYHRCPFDPHTDFLSYVGRMCDSFVARLREAETFYGRPFDVVHGHDWMCAAALARVRAELGRPAVLTLHSTEYGRCGNSFPDGISARIRDIEWQALHVADRVICVSRSLRDEVQRIYQIPAHKLEVIYNGVNVERFDVRVNTRALRRQCGAGLDDPLVLFCGRLAWQKGPDLLLEAAPQVLSRHARARFLFAGDGDMRGQLQQRAAALDLAPYVRFLGYQPPDRLVDLFRGADVVCVPSRNEPFGIVVLEAWSAQRPVVVTGVGGPAEFVRHRSTGLLVSTESESIAAGLSTALAEVEQARAWGLAGRREAEAHFRWSQIARQTEEVYLKVLNAA